MLGLTRPASSAAAIVTTLFVDPGSKTSVSGRLRLMCRPPAARGIGGRTVDGRHREHVAGPDVGEDRHAALAPVVRDLLGEHALGLVLERLVDGQDEVGAAHRRAHSLHAVRDVAALRVAFDRRPCRARPASVPSSPTSSPPSPLLSMPTKPEQRSGERARRVVALRLGQEAEPGELEPAHLSLDVVLDLARDVHERAVLLPELRGERRRVDPDERREPPAYASGILDLARVRPDARASDRHREVVAVAIEDAAALRRRARPCWTRWSSPSRS